MSFLALCLSGHAQISISLPEANIVSRSDYTITLNSGTFSSLIGLLPTISVRANQSSFTSTVGESNTVPLNTAHIRLRSIGSLSLLGSSSEVTLSTSYSTLYTALANLSSGAILADYRISTASNTWVAGTYSTPIQFNSTGGGSISPSTPNLNLTVPAFISSSAVGDVLLNVNNLSYFRTADGIAANKSIVVSTTVPYMLALRAESGQFAFSTSYTYNQLPSINVNTVQVLLSSISGSTSITLSNAAQSLTPATGIAVPTNNNQTLTANFAVNGANLKSYFAQAGTYTIPLTYTWNKPTSAYPTGPLTTSSTGNLFVQVSDLAELVLNGTALNLVFDDPDDYIMGLAVEMPSNLRLSKTTPYNLSVRATSDAFNNGSEQIPLSVMQIGPGSGQNGINTVSLTNTDQLLISGANPIVDRTLNLRYTIPASQTQNLLNKPSGTYMATVVFSLVGL